MGMIGYKTGLEGICEKENTKAESQIQNKCTD